MVTVATPSDACSTVTSCAASGSGTNRSYGSIDVEGPTGPPVEPVTAFEEVLVDQVPTQGRGVRMEHPELHVHVPRGEGLPGLEVLGQEVKDDEAHVALGGDAGQPAVDQEVAEDVGLLGGGAEVGRVDGRSG